MIELYHFGDAICCFKVRIALAEKGLNWVSHVTTDLRTPEYLALNPKGVVPTLVHDGHVLVESRIISEYLEEAFPAPPLLPATALDRHRVRLWTKQVDDSLHLNIFVLTFLALKGWGLSALSPEAREKRLPKDAVKRSIVLDLLASGKDPVWRTVALERFRQLMDDIDQALKDQPWLAGDQYSLADADLTAYMFRLSQLKLDDLWQHRPALLDWQERVRSRPSYRAGMTDWITPFEAQRYASIEA